KGFASIEFFPSWPAPFWPHDNTPPLDVTAKAWLLPAARRVPPASPVTNNGVAEQHAFAASLPSCPLELLPHESAVPSDFRAMLAPPAVIAMTPLPAPSPETGTGVNLTGVNVPSPSWPNELDPQDNTEPSDLSAKLYPPPVAKAVTPLPAPRPLTATGEACCVVVPSPSWPAALLPHATTAPLDFSASTWPASLAAAIAMTPLPGPRPLTWTGVSRCVVVPSPSLPSSLLPHANTVPSDFNA